MNLTLISRTSHPRLHGCEQVTNSGNWINYVAALAFIRTLLGVESTGDGSSGGVHEA
eukprot:COSAG02_NODE_46372_length_349_cov_0.976000_1_plen_56_part_10